jgi:hypothetical protein
VENQNRFRDANERIAAKARSVSFDSRVPFLCECTDERCVELVSLPLDEYDSVRSDPGRMVTIPGHPVTGSAKVVADLTSTSAEPADP